VRASKGGLKAFCCIFALQAYRYVLLQFTLFVNVGKCRKEKSGHCRVNEHVISMQR
jgi:hypothetical protein